jgi:hypothetical protein
VHIKYHENNGLDMGKSHTLHFKYGEWMGIRRCLVKNQGMDEITFKIFTPTTPKSRFHYSLSSKEVQPNKRGL